MGMIILLTGLLVGINGVITSPVSESHTASADITALSVTCNIEGTARVSGDSVSVSEALQMLRKECNGYPTNVTIFSTGKFNVDEDVISSMKITRLAIFAKEWEVHGSRRFFSLAGAHGEYLAFDKRFHGPPGLPGKNGGHFLGVYETILKGEKFEVYVNGGNGGTGVRGSDGNKGSDGGFRENGKKGSTGGNGGVGGIGGHPGTITIFNLKGTPDPIKKTAENGKKGQDGRGGTGGPGGNGEKNKSCNTCTTYPATKKGDKGQDGQTGGNKVGQQNPSPQVPVPFSDWAMDLSEFRKLLLKGKSLPIISMTNEMDNSTDILRNLVTPKSLAKDMFNLLQFYSLNDTRLNYDLEFSAILKRLENMVTSKDGSITNAEKLVLNYLYAAGLGKLAYLSSSATEATMVINVAGFFRMLEKDVKDLKSTQTHLWMVNQNQAYEEQLSKKQAEARELINTAVMPGLRKLDVALRSASNMAIDELNQYHEVFKKNLRNTQDQYVRYLTSRLFCGILKLVHFGGYALRPLLEGFDISKEAVNRGRYKLVSLRINPGFGNDTHKLKIPAGALEIVKYQENERKRVIELTSLRISTVRQFLDIYSRNGENFSSFQKISNSVNSLEGYIREGKIDKMEDATKTLFQTLDHCIDSNQNGNLGLALRELKFTLLTATQKREIKIVQSFSSFAKKSWYTLLEEATQHGEEVEAAVQSFRQEISPFLQGLAEAIMAGSDANALDKLSLSGLTVRRMHLGTSLRSFRAKMELYTNGLQAPEEFLSAVDAIQDAAETLGHLYQHLQTYEEQKSLGEYLGDLHSPQAQGITVKDGQLKEILARCDFLIKLTFLQRDHKQGIQAFKKWAFPYAHGYLKSYNYLEKFALLNQLTSEVQFTEKFGGEADEVSSQITELSRQLGKYETIATKGDVGILKQRFTSLQAGSLPFYVWEGDEWGQTFQSLFLGKKIMLKADISKADEHWSKAAIKFKTVDVYIKANNVKQQGLLNELLSPFTISMTHTGSNVYRVANQDYQITSEAHTFIKCFAQSGAADSCTKNLVDDEIDTVGEYLLSPFTTWVFQLDYHHDASGVTEEQQLAELSKFLQEGVDLELHGDGVYIDQRYVDKRALDNLHLKDYYTPVTSNGTTPATMGETKGALGLGSLFEDINRDIVPFVLGQVTAATYPNEFPWMVNITVNQSGKGAVRYICAGSLIPWNVVLTAAHCVVNEITNEVISTSGLTAIVGSVSTISALLLVNRSR